MTDKNIIWRGSVSDLVTDLAGALSPDEMRELAYAMLSHLHTVEALELTLARLTAMKAVWPRGPGPKMLEQET